MAVSSICTKFEYGQIVLKVQGHLYWWKGDFNVFLMGKYLVLFYIILDALQQGKKC